MKKLTEEQQKLLALFSKAVKLCNKNLPEARETAESLCKIKEKKSIVSGVFLQWMDVEILIRKWELEELKLAGLVGNNVFLADYFVNDLNIMIARECEKVIKATFSYKMKVLWRKICCFFTIEDYCEDDIVLSSKKVPQ